MGKKSFKGIFTHNSVVCFSVVEVNCRRRHQNCVQTCNPRRSLTDYNAALTVIGNLFSEIQKFHTGRISNSWGWFPRGSVLAMIHY